MNNNRYISIDYLRGFLIVLVVCHHSFLAYTSHGIGSLIVDGDRFYGIDFIVGFFDIFFMSLLFFISGLFVYKSIEKKGNIRFIEIVL